jgi:hypothetical protein
MLDLLIYVIVLALVIGLAYWLVDYLPVPQPLNKILKIVIMVIGVIAVIYLLMGLAGNRPVLPRAP